MDSSKIVRAFPNEQSLGTSTRPYVNHAVEFKKKYTASERMKKLAEIGWNVFFCPSEYVTGCDMLSDSGTTAMTNEQWAALHLGDEAYGSNRGYFLLAKKIREIWGEAFFNPWAQKPNAFIFHQGRPGEDALFTEIGKLGGGLSIPSNGHFDTTEANIRANRITAVNLFSRELKENKDAPFKGNIDTVRLKAFLEKSHKKIPLVYLTITNNTGGGQPVSMANIRETSRLAHHYNIPLFFDAGRFAENAWFIKHREKGYAKKTIRAIVREMFSHVDGCTVSFKKDGLGNMGGGIFLREGGLFTKRYPHIPDGLMNNQILSEGHPTYGGLTGRDIMALVVGLEQVVTDEYLDHRVGQVAYLGERMQELGLPMLAPFGGHAVYLDMNAFFADTKKKSNDFGGIAFAALLLGLYGHRVSELGNFAFGSYDKKTKKETFPEVNFVRLAIPRLRYERQDLDAVADAAKALYENRHEIPNVKVIYGKELPLRHFKARFELR